MDPPQTDSVKCTLCPFQCKYTDLNVPETITMSAPMPKPTWIKDEDVTSASDKHALIDEPCPKCNHPEMHFYTMQLRSVDEGSTVFYECPKCSHTFSQNN